MRRRQYNAICDVCGFRFKNWELRRRWDNLMVCEKDYETRHPVDFFRVRRTERNVPWSRPEYMAGITHVDYPSPVSMGDGLVLEDYDSNIPTGFFWLEDQQYIILEGA